MRCLQYLGIKKGYFSSPNAFTWHARREVMRRMNKVLGVDEDDQPRFSNKFMNRQQTDEPNDRIRVHFLHSTSKAFPTAFLDKQVVSMTENDYLFEKNFKEIYEKNFLHQGYKVQDRSFDGDKSTNDSDLLDESATEIEYHGEVIEEDEAIFNSKPVSERDNKSEMISFNGTFNDVKLTKYYQFLHEGTLCYMKLVFQNDFQGKSYIMVSYYHPARGHINYLDISNSRMINKINHIMSLNEEFTISALRSLFKYDISHPGRVLHTFHSSYDLSLIQQKNAFSLHPTYLKMDIMMQSDNLKAGFHSSTYYFMQSCASLGVCYIKMTVYKLKNTKMLDHNIDPSIYHFAMEVTPSRTRTKQYRVIFNTVDLSHLFNIPAINNDARSFMKIGRMILTNLLIYRNMIAKILVLPPLTTRPEKPEQLELLLYNNSFNVNAFENKAKFLNYFEPMQYGPKILYQGIRRFKRDYYHLTVEYIYKFDYWNIILYHPKTSRSFLVPIHFDDIMNLSSAFLYKAYPDFLHKPKMQGHTNYEEYQYVYTAFQNRMPVNPPESPTSGLFEKNDPNIIDKAGRGLMEKVEKVFTIPCLYTNRYHDARFEPPNFHEFKFWDNLMKNVELYKDEEENVYLKIDRYQSRLLEILHKSPIQLDRYTHGLIEIDIATTKKKPKKEVVENSTFIHSALNISVTGEDRKEFFTNFSNISYLSSINSLLNIRIFFSNSQVCQHERLNLREIINLYIADGLYKYQANYIDSKMNLADLQGICDYIVHKIKNSNLIDLQNENPHPNKQSNAERPDYRFKMKLATQISGEDNAMDREGILLYKKALKTAPYILLALNYDKSRDIVNATLYRPKDSQQQIKEFKMEDILFKIDRFDQMIENGKYKEAGRLFLEHYETYLENYGMYCLESLSRVRRTMGLLK